MKDTTPPRYVPTDRKGWIRDTHTGAILSVDVNAKKEHQQRVSGQKAQKEELNTLKQQVAELTALVKKHFEDN